VDECPADPEIGTPRLDAATVSSRNRFHPEHARATAIHIPMHQSTTTLDLTTRGPGLYEFTRDFKAFVSESGTRTGLATAYCRHTSASLLIQENADPDVRTDLTEFFRRIAPQGMEWIVHQTEGPDDMPAHIKSALTQTSISVPVLDGAPVLGTWQGIYLFEHRTRPHRRQVVLHIIGETT
jgi:secondary thiamine-phosphate synthase enzyme